MGLKHLIWILVTFFMIFNVNGMAEEITNYADCDACHGAIKLNIEETEQIFEKRGIHNFSNLPVPNSIKLDLDGVMRTGGPETDDKGFEIKVWTKGTNLYIKDLRDSSLIHFAGINTSFVHIYLEASKKNEINLKDPVDVAWARMQESSIYQWVSTEKDKDEWYKKLPEKIIPILSMLKRRR